MPAARVPTAVSRSQSQTSTRVLQLDKNTVHVFYFLNISLHGHRNRRSSPLQLACSQNQHHQLHATYTDHNNNDGLLKEVYILDVSASLSSSLATASR